MIDNENLHDEKEQIGSDYLRSKLELYSNLYSEHFSKIDSLEKILISYNQELSSDLENSSLKNKTKILLIEAGVYNDERILEFLLLIAEKMRSLEEQPTEINDENLCKYYFNKYRSDKEKWSQKTFNFRLKNNNSFQIEKDKFLEETAIRMIVDSRAINSEAIDNPPKEVVQLIEKVDSYFQKSFLAYFGIEPPVSILKVTKITNQEIEEADRISGNAFIDINYYYENKKDFIHLIIHEAMHLCFEGFDEMILEEGLIEYFIEQMLKKTANYRFKYQRFSQTYQEYRTLVAKMFKAFPESEKQFTEFFLGGKIEKLREYIKDLSESNEEENEKNKLLKILKKLLN